MHEIEPLLLALMVAVAGLSVLARMVRVPYPILLVVGGLMLGFVPGMPEVELPPELVLVAFLPPLLYWSGFASPRDLRADLRAISMLAVGLVLATAAAVAVVAMAAIDGMTWPVAFALGAIVSPTDPLAASAIGRRLGVPRRLLTVLEGESLVNDATALVAYRVAVTATVSGGFVVWQAGLRFVVGAAGGVAIGLPSAGLSLSPSPAGRPGGRDRRLGVHRLRRLPAGRAARRLRGPGRGDHRPVRRLAGPQLASAATRLLGFSFWEVLVYLANAVLFILVGLELRPILRSSPAPQWPSWSPRAR